MATPCLLVLLLGILGSTARAQDFYVAAPSTLRLNDEATVAIAIEGEKGALVRVYIQDYPGEGNNISEIEVVVHPGHPQVIKANLDATKFPEGFLTAPETPKLVSLNAHFLDKHKKIVIPISSQSGYMFIQTDKPIYNPKERANFRIISLTEDVMPSNDLFQLQIRNPKNIIVQEKYFNEKNRKLNKVFATHVYIFPTYPVLGEWSATVRFGHNLEQNSTVRFELREYVLPTFTVQLKTPDVILPDAEKITIETTAKHVYGQAVRGIVSFRLGVKSEHDDKPVYFGTYSSRELDDGEYTLKIKLDVLKEHKHIGWFPAIDKSRLVVEATVVDYATGNKEEATDSKAIFSNSPFVISFKRCLSDFKPGLTSVFEADITYVDGRPAKGISTQLTAVADNGQPLRLTQNTARSDDNGRVVFDIQPENHHRTVRLTLETNDPMYDKNQAKSTFEQKAFESPSRAYIAISRSSHSRLKPGEKYARDIYLKRDEWQNIYYLVVTRGKIQDIRMLNPGEFKHQRVEVPVTHEMVPDFRIVVFTHHGDELLADSLKVEVDRECNPRAQVTIEPKFKVKEPGNNGKISIEGTKDTAVGLLGVDEAVYALSKKDLLTKTKMFNQLSSHDLGCGPGGGINTDAVLGNAGIALGTNKYTTTPSDSCVEIKRRKREIAKNITEEFMSKEKVCCALGIVTADYDRKCENIIPRVVKMTEDYPNCTQVYVDCCLLAKENGLTGLKRSRKVPDGRVNSEFDEEVDFIDFKHEEETEKGTTVRSDFRETWFTENMIIGPDGKEELGLSLPHSITTWVIQAVSVSPEHGMCVADPKTLVSFKKLFLQLNLPYSVVRNEQVEIQATVFNYDDKQVGATVYMYGVKGLCSGTQPGMKSERKRLVVDAESAASVSFPVIPLNTGEFDIKVVVLSPVGSDVIRKKLYVVPEGITKEIDIPIRLDPTNQQGRKEREIETSLYSDHIDPTQNLQVTTFKLSVPEGFVPGTASCCISAVGDMFGPVVETTINNPEKLLQKPHGCGEQNMIFMAPTLYTMRYLKASGRLTADSEAKGYEFIRDGYDNELNFRKEDGSYAAWPPTPTSTWLTAFVMKVFCQATPFVHIDENVISSGVQWLIQNQEPDGSYVEKTPVYHIDMVGGVKGAIPMTAFVLIALEDCKCNEEGLLHAKTRSIAFLETHIGEVHKPLPVAIVAYALALSDSEMKQAAYDKLQALAKFNEDKNWMYWITDNSAQDVETAGYGLLTQLLFNNMGKSNAIVNWLNTKQLQSGFYESTQETVVALQALSEYAIRAQMPSVNLVSNITSSNDRNFHKVLTFREDNALLLQDVKIDKIGGTVFINTVGQGVGSLSVKLRYNLLQPPEDVCKFDVSVNVTDAKNVDKNRKGDVNRMALINSRNKELFENLSDDKKREVLLRFENENQDEVVDPDLRRRVKKRDAVLPRTHPRRRVRRQDEDGNSKMRLNIALCVRYLGNAVTGMSIVDVGIFSGFEPVVEDLKMLEMDPDQLISKYEKSSRGVVFYLDKVPIAESYCFSFDIIRQYLVGNTQMSVIKVYDYYNPDATCTKFYSPESNSPLIRTLCEGGVCECAEGGCPPQTPFTEISKMDQDDRRDGLKMIMCEKYDYVWKGKLDGRMRQRGGFLNISFTIDRVIKEGIEKAVDIEGETRTLLARDNCQTANFLGGVTYLVLGKDGQAYKNENGETWYRYLLDQTSVVYQWSNKLENAPNKQLQRYLNYVANDLRKNGCPL